MYSVNNKSQETTDEFYVMGSSRDNGRIKISQPKRVANQKIRTKNKQEHAGIRGGGPQRKRLFQSFHTILTTVESIAAFSVHFVSISEAINCPKRLSTARSNCKRFVLTTWGWTFSSNKGHIRTDGRIAEEPYTPTPLHKTALLSKCKN